MANALSLWSLTPSFSFSSSSSSSSSSLLKGASPKPFVSPSSSLYPISIFFPQPSTVDPSSIVFCSRNSKLWTALSALVDERPVVTHGINGEESVRLEQQNDDISAEKERKNLRRPCELYVCNLPRSFDIEQLLKMFKPHGNILSAEVCRNAETGESKGCGYVTMESINSARNAVAALDGSDVGGREMRVRFSVEMNHGKRNPKTMNSSTRVFCYEAPHRLYVGNLVRGVRPEQLTKLFSRFGTVVSATVLHDRKLGKSRVYAFLSFLSEAQRDAAMSLNGKKFNGRTLVVREGVERTEP